MTRLGPRGPLPTIGHDTTLGVTSVIISYRGLYCSGTAEITSAALGLPDDTPIIHIGKLKPFLCKRCQCREVEVRSKWPDPREVMRRKTLRYEIGQTADPGIELLQAASPFNE